MVLSATRLEQALSVTPATEKLVKGSSWVHPTLPESRLFGTDGIRGKAGELLTAPLALQVGFWAGQVFRAKGERLAPVVIGQDSRNSSSMIAMALAAGLTAAGLDVWDVGLCPTPGVAYLTQAYGALGGVMISASHNPPEDNGIKFFGAGGGKLALALQEQIEAALRGHASDLSVQTDSYGQCYHRGELLDVYHQALQAPVRQQAQTAQPFWGLRVVLDLAWGAATSLAATVFTELGAEVICLHDRPDGDRINVNCGSTHLASLKVAVKEHQADLGFAFDGDADRVLAVDSLGRTVDGDYILYLWGNHLKQANQLPHNTIVATVMSNLGFERAWRQQGGQLLRTAVGDQYVYAEMQKIGAALGGEQSGHIICQHFGVGGDGLMTALHLTALVCRLGVSLADLLEDSFKTYPQRLQNVRVEDRKRRLSWQECGPLQQAIARAESDMGDRGRVLVRASGTEPVIRVMVEAATEDLVDHWIGALASVVEQHLA